MPELTAPPLYEYREIKADGGLLRRWSAPSPALPVGHPIDQYQIPDGDRGIDGPYQRQQMIGGKWVTIFERTEDGTHRWI